MIIHHQDNIAAFAGGHAFYWPTQALFFQRVSKTTAAPSVTIIAQARTVSRFVESRVFGRVN